MRRFVDPAILAFLVALLVSIGLHLPAYEALGVLANRLLGQGAAPPRNTQIEIEVSDAKSAPEKAEPPAEKPHASEVEPDHTSKRRPDHVKPVPKHHPLVRKRPRPRKRKRPVEKKLVIVKKEPVEVQKVEPEVVHPLAVKQHSQDPKAKAPDHARFIARQNNRVDQETVARIRNDVRDDAKPRPGSIHMTPDVQHEVGSKSDTQVAQMRKMNGSDVRQPTPEEATERRPKKVAIVRPSSAPSGRVGRSGAKRRPSAGSPTATTEAQTAHAATHAQQAQTAAPQGSEKPLVINDGYGTLEIARPKRGLERSPGGTGKAASSQRAQREVRARAARRGAGNGGRGHALDANRTFAWSELQDMYGRARLEQQRRAYLRERQSSRRGTNYQRQWRQFRAAIENFVPNVRPGNQTALNAAASPFAEYMSTIHLRIHREFADKFLASLPTWGSSPFADQTLHTLLEIIINRDGSIYRVGVVRSSGFLPFDYGAWAAVMRAQPYPAPPAAILSGDGRVYLHWGFYRNQRECGTFNAQPYILPHPPDLPAQAPGPLQDMPAWGGVVPEGAQPTWGTDQDKGSGDGQQAPGGGDDNGGGTDKGKAAPPPDSGSDGKGKPSPSPPAHSPPVPPGSGLG